LKVPHVPWSWWPWPTRDQVNTAIAEMWMAHVDETEATTMALQEMRDHMAADRELLTALATDLTALAGPVSDLFDKYAASETARVAAEARVAELEGAAATDEAADLSAIQPVRDAFDVIASKFRAEPETPDVEPLPEPAPVEPTPEPPAA
jgi:hypothetical protein